MDFDELRVSISNEAISNIHGCHYVGEGIADTLLSRGVCVRGLPLHGSDISLRSVDNGLEATNDILELLRLALLQSIAADALDNRNKVCGLLSDGVDIVNHCLGSECAGLNSTSSRSCWSGDLNGRKS